MERNLTSNITSAHHTGSNNDDF